LYLPYKVASVEGLMHGLYLLWWVQEKQMSPAVVATVLAAGDLALMGLELPTGWFADRFGHRASLMVGSLVQVMGMLWCWLGEGVSGLVIASLLVALGDGFRSGADQAFLYRTCLALECEDDFQKIEARAEAVALSALVLLVLLGGVIVHTAGFVMGWFAETMLCFLGFAIACAMEEPQTPADRKGEQNPRHDGTPIRYSRLAVSIMPAALLGGAASAASFLAQTTGTKSPANVTVLVATLTAAEAVGSALASRLPPASRRDQICLAGFGSILFIIAVALPATLPLIALALGLLVGRATASRSRHSAIGCRQPTRASRVGGQRVRHGGQHDCLAAGGCLAEPPAAVECRGPLSLTKSDRRPGSGTSGVRGASLAIPSYLVSAKMSENVQMLRIR
jgi:MFS family permease